MPSYLLITVGGSHEPILRSLSQNRADRVLFFCSEDREKEPGSRGQVEGSGKVLKSRRELEKPDLPNIPTLAGLNPESWRVVGLADPDDLQSCYLTAAAELDGIRAGDPDARVTVDYTGGTKSMSAALVAAALDDGRCELCLVSGVRRDLVRVRDGTETVAPVRVQSVQVRRRLEIARGLLARFDYAGAARYIEELMKLAGPDTRPVLQRWLNLARAFDAWDRFDHAGALGLIELHARDFPGHMAAINILVKDTGARLEPVADLLNNAARRARQERFDDAVGRLYRALELTAQVWLRYRYELETGNVDLARVPEALRPGFQARAREDGKVVIGLNQAWDLLAEYPEDPLGKIYAGVRGRMRDLLLVRNHSILAHGQRSVTGADYREMERVLGGLARDAVQAAAASGMRPRPLAVPQLPQTFD